MARITRRNLMWSAAALLGIAATAAIGWAASQLARQPIGLSSDPISVANGLAPALPRDSHPAALAPLGTAAHPRERERRGRHHTRVLPPPAPSSPATATTTVIASASTSAPAYSGSSATAASPAAASTSAPAYSGSSATAAPASAGSTAAAPPPARNHDDSGDGGSHRDD